MNQPLTCKQGLSTDSCDVAAFGVMEREDCIRRWTGLFGFEPPRYTSVPFMRQALAHEAQLAAFGGLSNALKRGLRDIWRACEAKEEKDANRDADRGSDKASYRQAVVCAAATPALKPGTHLVREWNGRTYQVEVTEVGFRLDGKDYRSLSSIARKITGTAWSGPRFFGLKTR